MSRYGEEQGEALRSLEVWNRPMRLGTNRGLALVTVLLFSMILMMMVIALYRSVEGELLVSQNFRDQQGATFLAEAGVMDAVAQLETDPDWTAGFQDKTLPGIPGSYTVTFNTTGAPYSNLESVNNSDGSGGDNYRGTAMVPAGYVDVVCTAKVGSQKRTLEALVNVGGGLYQVDGAMVSTGRIDMRGDITVDGRAAIGDPTRVDGDIQSDLNDPGNNLVTYDGSGTALFDGKVSTVGSAAAAINLNGATPAGGTQTGASAKNPQEVNILGKIAAHSGATPFSVNSTGTTTLSPSGGDNKLYHSGDLVITDGDLVLNGVELYVDGNVSIKGSITGEGTLYVGGKTTFEGDARILAATPDKVGLFSEGDVKLTGFDGTAYMNSLATGGQISSSAWQQLGESIQDYQTQLAGSPVFAPVSTIDCLSQEISGYPHGPFVLPNPVTVAGRQPDVTGTLISQLKNLPQSSQRDKMISKLTQIRDLFYSEVNGSAAEYNALANLAQGRLVKGAFDSAIDNGQTQFLSYMRSYVDNIDYDHLGSAYFQGLVFTHGSFYADSEISILGALVAKNNGSQSPSVVNGENLNPGDVLLATNTRLRYIEDFFKPKDPNGNTGPQGANVALWVGR